MEKLAAEGRLKYRPDIDGLRAIAVLAVVIYHAFPLSIPGGFIGVDIFFIISGFLISGIVFDGLNRDTFSFVNFYSRRIRRIFPALILVLVACYAFGWFSLLAIEFKRLGKEIAGGAGFIANLLLWNESGYFDAAAESKPLLHLWSLGVEEQFYLTWPLLLWTAKRCRLSMAAVIGVLFIISFAWNIWDSRSDTTAAFYSPITRFWELLLGASLAYAALYRKFPALTKTSTPRSLIGMALLLAGFSYITSASTFPGWWALLPTFGAALIISAGADAWPNRIILSNKAFVAVGLISYPLYLWHWPILSFINIIQADAPSPQIRAAGLTLAFTLATLTYFLIERPIRFGRFKQHTTAALAFISALLLLAGYHAYAVNGFPSRFPRQEKIASVYETNLPYIPRDEPCENFAPNFAEFSECRISSNHPPDIVLLGDSHSGMLYDALIQRLPNHVIMNLGEHACLPFASDPLSQISTCERRSQLALKFLQQEKSVRTVILIGYWNYLGSVIWRDEGVRWRQASPLVEKNHLSSFQRNGISFVSALIAAKKRVIISQDVPDLDFNPMSCLNVRPLRLTESVRTPCAMDSVAYEKRVATSRKVIENIAKKYSDVRIFDPKSLFCDKGLCEAMLDNHSLYWNGDHLTYFGADLVVAKMVTDKLLN